MIAELGRSPNLSWQGETIFLWPFSRVNETKRYFLLDGDQNHNAFPIDLGAVSDKKIEQKICEGTGIDAHQFQYATDGSSNGDSSRKDYQKLAEQKKFLQYISDYFRFLSPQWRESRLGKVKRFQGWTQRRRSGKGWQRDVITRRPVIFCLIASDY